MNKGIGNKSCAYPMDVGLVTMHRVVNCGSQLQTYAMVKVVEKLHYKCTVIDYEYPSMYHYAKKMDMGGPFTFKGVVKSMLRALGILRCVQYLNLKLFELMRSSQMREGRRGLSFTRQYSINTIKKHPPDFNIYLVGSDQVWNPHCMVGDYTYLLDFVPTGKRKIAYSSSFGTVELDEAEREIYANFLSKFDAIGTRESSGVDIIEALGIKGAVAVLDPTMLLSREEWESYATNRRLVGNKYLFCYILSYVFKSTPWIITYTKNIANSLGCEVVFYGGGEPDCISEARAAGFKVLSDYISPLDFVRYYLDAEYVVANGFHGTAFAIALNKQCTIVVNPNPTKDNRVVSLLSRTGYSCRSVRCGEENCDYSKEWLVGNIVDRSSFDRLKNKSIEFLSSALSGMEYHGSYGDARD